MEIGPYHSKEGDIVTILYGGDLYFVLRPKGDLYELIGDAYVHGVIKGELFEDIDTNQMPQEQIFSLC